MFTIFLLSVSDELKDAACSALKESGVEFIATMNMYFNKNTGENNNMVLTESPSRHF